jgi:hypothetical protein
MRLASLDNRWPRPLLILYGARRRRIDEISIPERAPFFNESDFFVPNFERVRLLWENESNSFVILAGKWG